MRGWTLNYELALSTTVAAAPGVLSQPGPSILGRAPQFWESVGAPKKWPIWGGKIFFWTPQKKFHRGNGRDMCFLQKNWKKSVKFGLGGRSNISLPHIGGSHPVPSLSLLSTERRGTAMYYANADSLTHSVTSITSRASGDANNNNNNYPYVAAVATWTPGRLLNVHNSHFPSKLFRCKHDLGLESKVSPFKSFYSPGGVRANVGRLWPEENKR